MCIYLILGWLIWRRRKSEAYLYILHMSFWTRRTENRRVGTSTGLCVHSSLSDSDTVRDRVMTLTVCPTVRNIALI